MWQQPGCLRVNSAPQCQAVWQYVLHSSQPVCVLIETQWWPPAWCVCVCVLTRACGPSLAIFPPSACSCVLLLDPLCTPQHCPVPSSWHRGRCAVQRLHDPATRRPAPLHAAAGVAWPRLAPVSSCASIHWHQLSQRAADQNLRHPLRNHMPCHAACRLAGGGLGVYARACVCGLDTPCPSWTGSRGLI